MNTLDILPFYDHLTESEKERINTQMYQTTFNQGSVLYDSHQECLGLLKVIKGRIRVTIQSMKGKEVTLYHLEEGDIDILSASCVINQLTFDPLMVADTDVTVMVVPATVMSILNKDNIYVHSFIYETTARRFSDAMWTMQEILFLKTDQRVASFLLNEAASHDNLHLNITQEHIAKSISSAREVVSRVLKRMVKDGLITMNRKCIEIIDEEGLEDLLEEV